jgi:hypothetical protein
MSHANAATVPPGLVGRPIVAADLLNYFFMLRHPPAARVTS